jgi:hypothetical protein
MVSARDRIEQQRRAEALALIAAIAPLNGKRPGS